MAKALQECPGSGVLWAEEILVAQRAEQKSELLAVVLPNRARYQLAVCGFGYDLCVKNLSVRDGTRDGETETGRRKTRFCGRPGECGACVVVVDFTFHHHYFNSRENPFVFFFRFGYFFDSFRAGKSLEALKRCDNDPHVITAVARRFWADRKYAKARKWFNRAITLDPNMGDAWAAYYAFELQQGTEVEQADVLDR